MKQFNPENYTKTDRHRRIYAYTEVAYTTVDMLAALMFIVGSVLFFWSSTTTAGTWLFLAGSVFFALRPTVRLVREALYLRMGDYDDVIGDGGKSSGS